MNTPSSYRKDQAFIDHVWGRLMLAPGGPDWQGLRDLAASGADFNTRTMSGTSLLMLAAYSGMPDLVRFLLEVGAAVDDTDTMGSSALLYLCSEPDEPKIYWPEREEQMLDDRATLADRDEALIQSEMECFRLLADAGADIHRRDAYGNTPLILATWNGKYYLVEALIALGADVHARSDNGRTPLADAIMQRNPRRVALLRAAGAEEPN